MCRKLGVSRSGYYAWLKRPQKSALSIENEHVISKIREVYEESRRTYGSPRIHRKLREQGYRYNRKRIERLMRENQIVSIVKTKFKSAGKSALRYGVPNLLLERYRKAPSRPNTVWVGDVTYIRCGGKWIYLSAVMDLASREILGWSISAKRDEQLVIESLLMALRSLKSHKETLIFHTDQGVEYASNQFREILRENYLRQSMSRRGHCWDNAHMESFFHTIKMELIYQNKFHTQVQAAAFIWDYMHFYNKERMHSSLDYITPERYNQIYA